MDTLLGNRRVGFCFTVTAFLIWAEMPERNRWISPVYSVRIPCTFFVIRIPTADLGNVDSESTTKRGRSTSLFFFRQAAARDEATVGLTICHRMDVPRMKRSGGVGLFDFPGILWRIVERAGLIWEYRWSIRKNPAGAQAAIRTRNGSCNFAGLES